MTNQQHRWDNRQRNMLPLIPEYHHVKEMHVSHSVPEGAKIIAPHRVGEFREEKQEQKLELEGAGRATDFHRVGFFHTPEQFLSMAKTVGTSHGHCRPH